jgi:hypothetical protein
VDGLILPLVGIVVGTVVGLGGAFIRGTLRPRWARARLRRGRPVVVPATLTSDGGDHRRRAGRAARVGADVHIASAAWHVAVAASEPRTAATRGSVSPETGARLVRGDLTEGASVHLLIGDDIWLPASP